MAADTQRDATKGTTAPKEQDRLVDPLDLTVILPVRNEGAHIEAVLGDVLGQEIGDHRMEVLVVDGQSDDDTVARARGIAAQDGRVRVLDNPRRLSSAARAIGARAARGRFVAYVDGHCRIPNRQLLADMLELFERTQADCLSRPQPLVPQATGWMPRAIAAARTSPFGHSLRSTIYDDEEHRVSPTSAGAMYRREVFERVGHFDPAFDACEDVEFNWRCHHAGLVAWTSPKLAVAYEPRRTLPALYKQMHRYGLGRARLHRKHRKAFNPEPLIPAGFTLGLPVLALSPWLPFLLQIPLWAGYGLYALLAVLASLVVAGRKGWDLLPALPLVFLVIHVGLGMGYLRGWFSRRPPFDPETTT